MKLREMAGLALLAWSGSVGAGEIVVPSVAVNLQGKGRNVWSSEIYLVNPGPATARVEVAEVITGRIKVRVPCLAPVIRFREVPPYASALLTWPEMSQMLGCPEEFLGAFVLRSDAEIVVSSRLVNVRSKTVGGDVSPLTGLGQDVPGIPRDQLPKLHAVYMLPVLASGPCFARVFDSYLQLANPGEAPVVVTLDRARAGGGGSLVVDGVEASTPIGVTVAPHSFRQIALALPAVPPQECFGVAPPPFVFDLFFIVDGEIAVTGSVVDRVSQDARTVLPVATTAAPPE